MDDGGSPTTGMKKLSNRLMKLFGVDTDDVTEEEIISMVNEGHEQGVLQANEAEMIHNIFEFGDKDAKDIMVHRKNIIAIDGTMTFLEMLDFTIENNYSRYPVYIDDIDNIIGVLHIKEVLALCQKQEIYHTAIKDIKGLIREVDFIPETRNFSADGKVYFKSNKVDIELYTDEKDFELEERVEAALDAADLFWQKSEQYIKSENMYEVLYEVEG